MLEDHLDRKAIKPRPAFRPMSEADLGNAMRKLARQEGHRKGLPVVNPVNGLAAGELNRSDRVRRALANGPMRLKELSEALGIWPGQVHDYLRPLIATGEVVVHGPSRAKSKTFGMRETGE